jgi:hypothetical protein
MLRSSLGSLIEIALLWLGEQRAEKRITRNCLSPKTESGDGKPAGANFASRSAVVQFCRVLADGILRTRWMTSISGRIAAGGHARHRRAKRAADPSLESQAARCQP